LPELQPPTVPIPLPLAPLRDTPEVKVSAAGAGPITKAPPPPPPQRAPPGLRFRV